jgi:aminoglycoside phosphotransferase (APT) family kinase protein
VTWDALARWLAPVLGVDDDVEVEGDEPATTGYSAQTVVVTVRHHGVERRLVLRIETADPPIYPQQVDGIDVEIDIQRRVMTALAAREPDIPLARVLGHETDPSVLGAPFFVMEFVDGEVPLVDPPYTTSGFFVDASPEERARMVADGLRVMARIHAVDWQAAGLEWLLPRGARPTLGRQLEIWDAFARRELRDRRHPGIDRAADRLRADLGDGSAASLCWGDPRPGNMIWRDFRCACVTDFEAAAIAPPELDLGWWLMFDRASHEVVGAPRLPGEPTRDEQRDLYAAASGRPVGDTFVHELFAAFRYAAIVVRVMNRAVERGHMPADHTIWLENPAATCLAQLLDE